MGNERGRTRWLLMLLIDKKEWEKKWERKWPVWVGSTFFWVMMRKNEKRERERERGRERERESKWSLRVSSTPSVECGEAFLVPNSESIKNEAKPIQHVFFKCTFWTICTDDRLRRRLDELLEATSHGSTEKKAAQTYQGMQDRTNHSGKLRQRKRQRKQLQSS